MCKAASGEANSTESSGSTQWPSSRRDAPNACHSGGRSGESTISSLASGIFSSPSGGMPIRTPCPSVKAMTRSWSSASTIIERLYPMRAPDLRTSESTTSMRVTSRASSRIRQLWMTGFGTATRSEPTSPSGALMDSGATSRPPAALRMSRRSVTVLSTAPVFIELWLRPM